MKAVLQRVSSASVSVTSELGDEKVGEISQGYVILLGIAHDDTTGKADKMLEKIKKLRLFPDAEGKTNRSITDINGEILVISQFTLYADCRKGTRPSFTGAASPVLADELYAYFIQAALPHFAKVNSGKFGASMQVQLVNDGPFTVILDI